MIHMVNAEKAIDLQHLCSGPDGHVFHGVGLCRIEHIYAGLGNEELVANMQAILLDCGDTYLNEWQSYIYQALMGFVQRRVPNLYVRLFDPPIHEFMPTTKEGWRKLAQISYIHEAQLKAMVELKKEVNPMMGLRGVRLCVLRRDILKAQLQAIASVMYDMRDVAGHSTNIVVIVPMVSSPREVAYVQHVAKEHSHTIQIGAMIETPRACLLAGKIASLTDYLSIGTNDLTQFAWGISRDESNSIVKAYKEIGILDNDPFEVIDESGVGGLICMTVQQAKAANPKVRIGVCGEQAGKSVAVLEALGVDYISVAIPTYNELLMKEAA